MSLLTYLNPDAIKDASIEGIKLKDGSITSSKIDSSVASTEYVNNAIANIDVAQSISITWRDLKAKRDAGELVPGMQYRITDYQCTTTQANTKSAGHQFDIIVVADDERTLNETARAAKHEDDTYFANNDLSAWQIWYCLNNDTTRFAWADETNGKGVIYRMIDEFNNDVPYDFKNIQFRRVDANTITVIRGVYYNDFSSKIETFFNSTKNTLPFKYQYLEWRDSSQAVDEGFADLLGMTNEELKDSGLFYAILDDKERHRRYENPGLLASVDSITDSNSKWIYTFNSNTFTDNSLDGYSTYIFYNEIGIYLIDGVGYLSNNCFFGNNCHSNTFGNDCHSNTFGNNCDSNTFGDSCNSNTFGNNCEYNTFGNDYHSNTFGNNCDSNTFGNDYCSNTFGNYCYSNIFGNSCEYNIFGNSCEYNTFGNSCNSNTFGNYCEYNTFGNDCNTNTFGDSCNSNTFGNSCDSNTFGDSCYFNTFGNSCFYNTFGNYCYSNTFGNYCEYNAFATDASGTTPASYFENNKFESGVFSCILINAETASSSNQAQNYHLKSSVVGTLSNKRVIETTRNLTYDVTVALNSEGTIKTYCEADLTQ